MADRDTIYAPATAAGRAAVAVVRLSGPRSRDALLAIAGGARNMLPPPREAAFRRLRDPAIGLGPESVIDEALVLWLPGPRSETGEDMAELQFHGGRAVMAAVLALLARIDGLRLAEPGEFARRAFDNGKLDLTALEAIGDLVNAETEAQRKQALRQMDGGLGRLYEIWRERLVRALAHLEAAIDFPDESLPDDIAAGVAHEIASLAREIRAHLDDGHRGERLREGLRVVLTGAPNVGKSSIFNLLVRREAAIVAPEAGTTRDVIEAAFDLGGYPVLLADTAGIREEGIRDARAPDIASVDALDANDSMNRAARFAGYASNDTTIGAVEQEGIRRARQRADEADLRIRVLDATEDQAGQLELREAGDPDTLLVLNKIDLAPGAVSRLPADLPVVALSAVTGEGVAELEQRLASMIAARLEAGNDAATGPVLTRARHREALEECLAAIGRMAAAGGPELAAEDLRLAVRALGRVTGRVDVEDLLDVIFRDFCIGK
ncbi:MAG: tRNA uridine-5-carboxymethylaminomethyl(34) synthesis GTPase MnmE [Rhodospirillaceae bacterium]|nr:tRNA uridine-5-carboxymethylaminomethyl(34) synthesis GTPase MnmE [Rhodospirillaceae bacterium]